MICDDSGSMNNLADPDVDRVLTRWEELKQLTRITIDALNSLDTSVDIYFLNRGSYSNVCSFDQVASAFFTPPSGFTNTVKILNIIARN